MINVNFFFKLGHRSRSRPEVKIFYMSGKPLSQETYKPKGSISNGSKVMTNVKVVQPTNPQTNKQTGQKQYVPTLLLGT